MAVEVEAKMRAADPERIEQRLLAIGAEKVATLFERNAFFDTPDGALKGSDRGLRVREEHVVDPLGQASTVTITYKGPRAHGPLKNREEVELRVADAKTAAELLRALGHTEFLRFEKRRRRWRWNRCNVELDELPSLGCFVEIEGPDDTEVFEAREALGLADSPLIHETYPHLLAAHRDREGLTNDALTFGSTG